jgi:heme/copper-type cytochrome/quinol oxidase subunit 2
MRIPRTLAATSVAIALIAIAAGAAAAAGGAVAPPLWTHGVFTAKSQHIGFTIRPAASDERVSVSNFAVRPGDPVTVTVTNYTAKAHTFTAPGLGISAMIPAGSQAHPRTTVFTFTAGSMGTFRWWCATPCGDNMGGTIYAVMRI